MQFGARFLILPSLQVCWKEVESAVKSGETSVNDMLINDTGGDMSNSKMTSSKREVHSIRDRYKKDEDQ